MCVTILSDFPKLIKFKDYPLLISVLDDRENAEGVYNLDIDNTAAQAAPSTYVYEACEQKYPIHLYWLNRQGGWDSYVFNWKHEYSEEVSGGVQYRDADFIPRYSSRGDDIETVNVRSGMLPDTDGMTAKQRFNALVNIRRSIQVYEFRGAERIPVIINEGSFTKYRVDERFFEISFQMKYAPLLIQKQ